MPTFRLPFLLTTLVFTSLLNLYAGTTPDTAHAYPATLPATPQPCAASITPSETFTCAISTAAETDTITFSGVRGDVMLLRVGVTAGDLRPQAQVMGPGAVMVCSGAYSYAPGFEISRCLISQTGTHTITISDAAGTRTGNYNVYLQSLTAPVGATALPIGLVSISTISAAAEANTFMLTTNAPAALLIRMAVTAGTMSPNVRVFGADGTAICTGSYAYGPAAEITRCAIPQAGTYTVLAGDLNVVQNGTYNLYVQHLSESIGAAPLLPGETRAATIQQAAEADSYRINATANEVWFLRAGANAGEVKPLIRVFGADGAVLCSAGGMYYAGAEINRCALPQVGMYTVLVADAAATNTGGYGLYAQRVTSPANASVIMPSSTTLATLQAAGEADTYTISATAGDALIFRLGVTAGSITPGIIVYDQDGVTVCTQSNAYYAGIEISRCAIPRTGSYTIIVGDGAVTRTGSYNLYVQSLVTPALATPISASVVQTGTIQRAAAADAYAWSAGDNDTIKVLMSATTNTLHPYVRVYDPDGVQVCQAGSSYATSAQLDQCLLPRRGVYTILAADASATGSGSYRLSLTCVTTPCGGPAITPRADTHVSFEDLDLTIPAAASTQSISVTVAQWTIPPTSTMIVLRAYQVQAQTANGVAFTLAQPPATYRIRYNATQLAAQSIDSATLRLALWNEAAKQWVPLTSSVDAARSTVSGTSTQIGNVALITVSTSASARAAVYLPMAMR